MGDRTYSFRRLTLIDKLFNIYLVLLPILQYYKSFVPSMNMATFLAAVFIPLFVIDSKGKMTFYNRLIPIVIYLLFVTFNVILTSYMFEYDILTTNIMEYLRMLMLVFSILILGAPHFDCDYALSVLEKVLIASVCFMVIQLFFIYVVHRPITGNIPALVTNKKYRIAKDRVSGFYMEPAAYAQSALLYIVFKVFSKGKKSRTDIVCISVVVGGILLSGSGQGYAFLLVVLLMWIVRYFFLTGFSANKAIKGVLAILLILLAVSLLMRTSYGQHAVSRIVSEDSGNILEGVGGKALRGRTYTNNMFFNLSPQQQVWGVGFGNVDQIAENYYINSLHYYLIEGGYVALGVMITILVITFLRGDLRIRLFAILYCIMIYFTGCARPMMLCFFFMFMLMGREDRFIVLEEDEEEDEYAYPTRFITE